MNTIRLVVAVPTFKRPHTLVANLGEVTRQSADLVAVGEDQISARVVVIDNDPACSARDLVAGFPDVEYISEPSPGIVAVRNRALDTGAHDDLLVFIDDDETPAEHWLQTLVHTWHRYQADAVWGRVESVFDGPVDPWIVAGEFFVRQPHHTGERTSRAATNNLLLDLRTVRRLGARFEDQIGLGGGEDTLFSAVLVDGGASIVWCDEAVVHDHVPVERATRRWVLERKLSHGNVAIRVDQLIAGKPGRRVRVRLRALCGGFARLGYGGLRFVAGKVTRSLSLEAHGARAAVRGFGMMMAGLGLRYEEYSRESSFWSKWRRDTW